MTPDAKAPLAQLQAELEANADPARAEAQQAYLKSSLRHLGLSVPEVRGTVRRWLQYQGRMTHDELWAIVEPLWRSPIYEHRLAAVESLSCRKDLLTTDDLPTLRSMIGGTFTWALVDPLSIDVVGNIFASMSTADADATFDSWAADNSFWVQRAAMLCQLRYLRRPESDPSRFFRYADSLLNEPEFFIRKAIGWVLRDMSRSRPDVVFDWLRPRANRASGVTLREAVKYLSANQQQAIENARARGV